MKLWIVGRTFSSAEEGHEWVFQGVFDTQKAAEAACLDETYFVGPCILNESIPEEIEIWPGCYRMMAATQ